MEQQLRSLLKEGKLVSVTFTKRDGSSRTMLCTQNFDLVPADSQPRGGFRVRSDSVVTVWDVENFGWRSIPVDGIERVEVAG